MTEEDLTLEEPVHAALKNLFSLVSIDRIGLPHFAELMAFMGRLAGPFQELLVTLDSRALMIILYWMALLSRLDLWWARRRIAIESCAIIQHLELDHSQLVQTMLKLPRSIINR